MLIKSTEFMRIDEMHYESTYSILSTTKGGKKEAEVVFKDMADLFTYGCIIGFLEDCPQKIDKNKSSIRWQALRSKHQALLIAIAVQKIGDMTILNKPNELRVILEEHSNGGLFKIHELMTTRDIQFTEIESIILDLYKRYK
jgi:hypothetical protein